MIRIKISARIWGLWFVATLPFAIVNVLLYIAGIIEVVE